MSTDPTRTPNAQSPRSLRVREARAELHLEPGGIQRDHTVVAVDLAAVAAAAWSASIRVEAWDRIALFVEYTKGSSTGWAMEFQASPDDNLWFTLMLENASGVLAPVVRSRVVAADENSAFMVDPVGYSRFFRYRIGAAGTATDSRVKVHYARNLRGL